MRKQLHEVELIDKYLLNKLDEPERFLFETKLILDPKLKVNIFFQRRAHYLIQWFGRQEKKKQLDTVFSRVMNDRSFADEIQSLFT